MSAYILHPNHTIALVNFGRSHRVSVWDDNLDRPREFWKEYNELGQILVDENYKSVNYRYRDNLEPHKFVFKYDMQPRTPVQILRAINTYDYQSCEHPDYEKSLAKWIIDCLQSKAIHLLPGYDLGLSEIRDL